MSCKHHLLLPGWHKGHCSSSLENPGVYCCVLCVRNDHSPSLVSVQLMENRVVTVLKHQVKFPLPSEDFNKVHKVGMLELLKTQKPRFAKLGL